MKKRKDNSLRASALRITLAATLISIAAVLLASSFKAAPATNELGASIAPSSGDHKASTIGSWTATGSLHFARAGRTGTALLSNGKVLVSGGSLGICCGPLNSAELYDPASGTWAVTGSLNFVHYYHTATLLPNGKVLAAGGANSYPENVAELYDPAIGTWTLTGSLHAAREIHTATLLPNGKVLVAGGYNDNSGASILASAELYDPASGTWTFTGSLNTARAYHTATLLPNGKVLVAGGIGRDVFGHSIAELYDPTTGAWTLTGNLNVGRYLHTATLLPNGKVLVAGGDGTTSSPFNSAELYDPASGTWTLTGSLVTARDYHTATLLPDGRVLVAGGYNFNFGGSLRNAELYDPASGSWTGTGSLHTARVDSPTALLPNGKVLMAAGANDSAHLSSAELYESEGGVCTICHKHTMTLSLTCGSLEYQRHLDHGDTMGTCPPSKSVSAQTDSLGRD